MTTTISFEVDDELMEALRSVRRQKRSAGRRGQRTAELSEESDADVIAGLIRDAYGSQITREKNTGASSGVIGADASSRTE